MNNGFNFYFIHLFRNDQVTRIRFFVRPKKWELNIQYALIINYCPVVERAHTRTHVINKSIPICISSHLRCLFSSFCHIIVVMLVIGCDSHRSNVSVFCIAVCSRFSTRVGQWRQRCLSKSSNRASLASIYTYLRSQLKNEFYTLSRAR